MSPERATRDLLLPHGCIGSDALHQLADAMVRLSVWHRQHSGAKSDLPCLRRIEANGSRISAHISTGPDVGGSWTTLVFDFEHGWRLLEEGPIE